MFFKSGSFCKLFDKYIKPCLITLRVQKTLEGPNYVTKELLLDGFRPEWSLKVAFLETIGQIQQVIYGCTAQLTKVLHIWFYVVKNTS